MERVTGIGGVFFRAADPAAMLGWYEEHLGLVPDDDRCAVLPWRHHDDPDRPGSTTWAPFPADTTYFGPDPGSFMINYRVASLDRMREQLRAAGVTVDDATEESEFGRFGWFTDPEGNRAELWEPPAGK